MNLKRFLLSRKIIKFKNKITKPGAKLPISTIYAIVSLCQINVMCITIDINLCIFVGTQSVSFQKLRNFRGRNQIRCGSTNPKVLEGSITNVEGLRFAVVCGKVKISWKGSYLAPHFFCRKLGVIECVLFSVHACQSF